MNRPGITALLTAAALLLAAPVWAHNVIVFGWVEGDTVHTQSKFSGGRKVTGGTIEVFDQAQRKRHVGTTDDQGNHSFALPDGATELTIVLTAGSGHAGRWTIGSDELGAEETAPAPSVVHADAAGRSAQAAGSPTTDIEAIVTRVVQRELAPLKARLAGQNWGFRDILSGIGYILGLVGLAAYVRYRKGGC